LCYTEISKYGSTKKSRVFYWRKYYMRNPFRFKKNPKSTIQAKEVGVRGDVMVDEFTKEEEKLSKITIKDCREMLDTDATVEALFNVVTLPILSAGYSVQPDDDGEEQAQFVHRVLFQPPHSGGMQTPFSLFLEQMLLAICDGFEIFERVMRVEPDGKIAIKKLAYRDPKTITLKVDDSGEYNGARQKAQFGNRVVDVELAPWNTFLFTYNKSRNFLYGMSAFTSIYRNYDKKRKIEYFDTIGLQSSARKPLILKRINDSIVKDKSKTISKVLHALGRIGELKSAAAIPYGFEIEALDITGRDPNASIERQNSEMARKFLASFILLGTQGSSSVGSYALSADQSDLFMISLRGIMGLIEEHINWYLIADLIDINFTPNKRKYPTFKFNDLTSDTVEIVRQAFTKFIEKDKISDDFATGVEQSMAQKMGIDLEKLKKEREKEQKKQDKVQKIENGGENGGNATSFPDPIKTKKIEPAQEVEEHNHARELTEAEKVVKFSAIEKWTNKNSDVFAEKAKPILTKYIEEVAESPDGDIKLPEQYINLLKETYRNSYNYGKINASDELKEKAPKTAKQAAEHEKRYIDFLIETQTNDIKALIAQSKIKTPLQLAEGKTPLADLLKNLIVAAGATWLSTAVESTQGYIVHQGIADGRDDAFAALDVDLYQWSAVMENTCATCAALDGKIVTKEEKDNSPYQPPIHPNCACIWVGMKGGGGDYELPEPTGIPEEVYDIDHIQKTPKKQLIDDGELPEDETKRELLGRKTLNNTNSGETLDDAIESIKNNDYETFVAFDDKGKKIIDYTDYAAHSVSLPQTIDAESYLKKHEISVILHNHPSYGDIEYIDTFSPQDIYTSTQPSIKESVVVNTKYKYSIKPGKKGWGDLLDMPFEELSESYKETLAEATKKANDLVKIKKITAGDEAIFWAREEGMRIFAKKYGITYKRREL
jgi:hypothetical protein